MSARPNWLGASNDLSASCSTLMNSQDAVARAEASEVLRRAYLDIHSIPLFAERKAALNAAARTLATTTAAFAELAVHQSKKYKISWAGDYADSPAVECTLDSGTFFTVGRGIGSDRLIKNRNPDGTEDCSVSRTHALLTVANNKLIVVDIGSLAGIHTDSRSAAGRARKHSTPNNRDVLQFDLEETVVLSLGAVDVRITPVEAGVTNSRMNKRERAPIPEQPSDKKVKREA